MRLESSKHPNPKETVAPENELSAGQTPPTAAQIRRWRKHLADERMEAATYRKLAKKESEPARSIMLALADAESRHEAHWLTLLGDHAYPPPKPAPYSRVLNSLATRFGSVFALAMAQRSEQRTSYDLEEDATEQMAADEHIHGEVVRSLAASSRERIAGSFRAAVFGINDGLISNLALILGVAGAGMGSGWIITTGASGLLAGSLSMAAGEWISVSGQKELLDASTPDPNAHHSLTKLDVNSNELALLFQARGESASDAKDHAERVFVELGDEENEPGTLTLGLESAAGPSRGASDAAGKPLSVAFSSFIFFALGAFTPLVPYLFGAEGLTGLYFAAGLVGIALLVTGGLVGVLSGKAPWIGALRQLLIGFAAAAVTFALGSLIGGGS